MKNVIPYSEDCFTIHKKAVDKKHSGELKTRLLVLNTTVEKEYGNYEKSFFSNSLTSLIPNMECGKLNADLLTLYSYQSSTILSVRESIRKKQIKTIISTCQNCTIDSANTLDHILAKSDYPEFVVNPKNLFPCCSTCNSFKLDAKSQIFLNLYLDILPSEQYLFIDVYLDGKNELDFNFFLKNVNNKISTGIFSIIISHYTKLHLLERMKLKSIEYISEFSTIISKFKSSLKLDEIKRTLIQTLLEDKKAYGDNHWKCILEEGLLGSDLFMKQF